ncbi:cytochrome P450 315a1, mitochondrial [Periplaneta americana]|uniref:cytochrome P450 315a1, mitochondrial n=1 Tax=Periplaneta americana TaxID=6978 RepID=UPI0037E94129
MWRRAVSSWFAPAQAREMPSPRGLPVVGTMLDLIAAGSSPHLHEYVDARHRQLGPVYKETIGPVTAVFVCDPTEMRRVFSLEGKYPKHILPDSWVLYNKMYGCKRGLFFMDGEEWLANRRVLNKLLLRPDNSSVVASCDIVATDLVERWRKQYGGRELAHLESDLYRWAIDIMVSILMGDKYLRKRKEMEDILAHFASVVHLIFQESSRLSLLPASLAAFLRIPAWKSFVSAIDEAIGVANRLVLQMVPECQNGEGLLGAMLAEGMEHKNVVRIVADLVLAAGDTTAYSTQWMLYSLAFNQETQEELCAELQNAHTPDDMVQLPLLKGVMREALRMYPVAPFLTRYLAQDSLIGGYHVSAGELVILSLYSSGRDEKNFPKPNDFWPHRWTRDSTGNYKGVYSPYASMPFAMGVRSCIGRKISEIQITLLIAKVVKQFKLELVDKKAIDMVLRLVAVPSRPIRLWLTER